MKKVVDLMIDSGAFTSWTKGKEIILPDYIQFLKDNEDCISSYINLDVIPGRMGAKKPLPGEIEVAAQKGWDNLIQMEDAGLTPIPVFHFGEDFKWLDKIVEHGCPYIGLGALSGISTQLRRRWLDKVFTILIDSATGKTVVKVHGFALTSIPLMRRYPWYSVDSTTWVMVAAYGNVLIPAMNASGEFDFSLPPVVMGVSSRSPAKAAGYKHFESSPAISQEAMRKYFSTLPVEVDADKLKDSKEERLVVNILFYKQLEALPFDKSQIASYRTGRIEHREHGFFPDL